MKLIMENWREYEKREEILSDHEYITEVLGVKISLTEAYPYSPARTEEIYREQQLLEQWWFGDSSLMEGAIGNWFSDLKGKVASYPETLRMLYRATTDKGKLHTFSKSLYRNFIKIKDKIIEFIDFIIEKIGNFEALQKLAEWAQKVKEAIAESVKWVEGITKPWMKALGLVALFVGIKYAWSKIEDYAKEFFGCGDEDGQIEEGVVQDCFIKLAQDFFKDKVKELFGATLIKIRDTAGAALTGGVTVFWNWLKKIADKVDFVIDALEPILAFFKRRGGFSESIKGEGILYETII